MEDNNVRLIQAAVRGDLQEIIDICEAGVSRTSIALEAAIIGGHTDVANYLISKGAKCKRTK